MFSSARRRKRGKVAANVTFIEPFSDVMYKSPNSETHHRPLEEDVRERFLAAVPCEQHARVVVVALRRRRHFARENTRRLYYDFARPTTMNRPGETTASAVARQSSNSNGIGISV